MTTTHRIHALDVSLQCVRLLAPIVRVVRAHDRDLADQMRRAASSVALNVGEALGSTAGNRRARLETALGSAHETSVALEVAVAWGYVDVAAITAAERALDRVRGLIHGLARR